MRSDRRPSPVLALAAVLAGCGGFRRGDPWDDPDGSSSDTTATTGAGPSFAADVHPILVEACAECHAPGASAGDTALVLAGAPDDDLASARDLVDLERPADSRLLTKAAGVGHVGGALIAESDPEYATILAWIAAGAPP